MPFKSPNYDTLTETKETQTTSELLEYLSTVNPDSAEYVTYLLSNLDTTKIKDSSKDVNDKLTRVNEKILEVLKRIQADMRDEQDTSIKHIPELDGVVKTTDGNQVAQGAAPTIDNSYSSFSPLDLLDFDYDRRERDRVVRDQTNKDGGKDNGSKSKTRGGKFKRLLGKIGDIFSSSGKVDTKPNIDTKPKVPDIGSSTKPTQTTARSAKDALPELKKPDIPKPVESSVLKSGKAALRGAGAVAGKAVPALGAALAVAEGAMAYSQAENTAERVDAIAENAGAAAGAAIGAVIGSFIPIPVVGTMLGALAGEWLGRKAGSLIGNLIKDPEDSIPDKIKAQGIPAQLEYIDAQLIPKILALDNLSEEEKKKQVKELEDYKEELAYKLTPKGRQETLVEQLEERGVIDTNVLGSDEVLKWDEIKRLEASDLEILKNHRGFNQTDRLRIEEILNTKKPEEIDENKETMLQGLDAAIEQQNQAVQKALASGDEEEIKETQEKLEELKSTKAKLLKTNTQRNATRVTVVRAPDTYTDSIADTTSNVPTVVTTSSLAPTVDNMPQVQFNPTAEGGDHGFRDQVAQGTNQRGSERATKVAEYATKQAVSTSQGKCALYIRKALQFGGNFQFTPQGSAYLYNNVLPGLGFKAFPASEPAKIGDVIVYGRTSQHQHGHIQVWNGKNWVSDFVQRRAVPYTDGYDPSQSITLYRYTEVLGEVQNEKDVNLLEDTKPDLEAVNTLASTEEGSQSVDNVATEVEPMTDQAEDRIDLIEDQVAQATNVLAAQSTQSAQQVSVLSTQVNAQVTSPTSSTLNDAFDDAY